MWTQLGTPNKMAPVFVDLCAGLVVLLPRQIRRFRHGFFLSAVLDRSLRSCLRVRHLWRQQIADNRRYLRRSFLPWTSSLRSQISLSKRWKGYYGKPLDEAVSNFFFEPSLSEKFGLSKIPIGNHIHLNLTSMCGFSLNPPPPPPPPPQLYPQNDWAGWQIGVNVDVRTEAPLNVFFFCSNSCYFSTM